METPEEKYHNDPDFHSLVDIIEGCIHHAQFTPSEIRQAATLGCIHYEMKTVRRYRIPKEIDGCLVMLEEWRKENIWSK